MSWPLHGAETRLTFPACREQTGSCPRGCRHTAARAQCWRSGAGALHLHRHHNQRCDQGAGVDRKVEPAAMQGYEEGRGGIILSVFKSQRALCLMRPRWRRAPRLRPGRRLLTKAAAPVRGADSLEEARAPPPLARHAVPELVPAKAAHACLDAAGAWVASDWCVGGGGVAHREAVRWRSDVARLVCATTCCRRTP